MKQKLKENLDNNLTSYILSTKAKEQKIMELLEIINQYESQIISLNAIQLLFGKPWRSYTLSCFCFG